MGKILNTLLIITAILMFNACSNEKENLADKAADKVDEMTTKAADAAVKKIRTPLNKARATKDLGEERMKAINGATQDK